MFSLPEAGQIYGFVSLFLNSFITRLSLNQSTALPLLQSVYRIEFIVINLPVFQCHIAAEGLL
jgi:hypothetical protein